MGGAVPESTSIVNQLGFVRGMEISRNTDAHFARIARAIPWMVNYRSKAIFPDRQLAARFGGGVDGEETTRAIEWPLIDQDAS